MSIATLLKRNGMTVIDENELSNGTIMVRLDNGCIINQTCTGHIYLQGLKSEPVAGILAVKMPYDCLSEKEAKAWKDKLYEAAKADLLGQTVSEEHKEMIG